MDEISYLRVRNIELETELRLVKNQLAEAREGTQYLVNCFNQQALLQSAKDRPIDRRLYWAPPENAVLQRRLDFTQHVGPAITAELNTGSSSQPKRSGSAHPASADLPPFSTSESASLSKYQEVDLLTFDDQGPSALEVSPTDSFRSRANAGTSMLDSLVSTPRTPITPEPTARKPPIDADQERLHGLGITHRSFPGSGDASVAQYASQSTDDGFLELDHANDDGLAQSPDFDPSIAVDPVEVSRVEWRAIRVPSPPEPEFVFSRPFASREHNRLMGAACYIEEMSEDEQAEHWDFLADDTRLHSPQEWKVYYENVIRPAYQQTVAENAGAAPDVAQQTQVMAKAGGRDADPVGTDHEVKEQGGLRASMWAPKGTAVQTSEPVAPQRTDTGKAESSTDLQVMSRASDLGQTQNARDFLPFDGQILKQAPIDNGLEVSDTLRGQGQTASPRGRKHIPAGRLVASAVTSPLESSEPQYDEPIPYTPTGPRNDTLLRRSPRYTSYPREVTDVLHNIDSLDHTLYHTALITNIPPNVTLSDVLGKVRGGKIVSATSLATTGMNTVPRIETNAAMVVFLGNHRANDYVDFCTNNFVFFWSTRWSAPLKATVSLVQTSTCPLDRNLLQGLREHGLTRIFFIIDDQKRWSSEQVVEEMLRDESNVMKVKPHERRLKRPLVSGRDRDGMLVFEYADVRHAALAWNAVHENGQFFGTVSKGYLPDPCDRPLETLKQDCLARKPKAGSVLDGDDVGQSDCSDGDDTTEDIATSTIRTSFESRVADGQTVDHDDMSKESEGDLENPSERSLELTMSNLAQYQLTGGRRSTLP